MGSLRADHTSLTPDFSLKEKNHLFSLYWDRVFFVFQSCPSQYLGTQNGDTELGLIVWQIPPVLTDDTRRAGLESGEGPLLLFPASVFCPAVEYFCPKLGGDADGRAIKADKIPKTGRHTHIE